VAQASSSGPSPSGAASGPGARAGRRRRSASRRCGCRDPELGLRGGPVQRLESQTDRAGLEAPARASRWSGPAPPGSTPVCGSPTSGRASRGPLGHRGLPPPDRGAWGVLCNNTRLGQSRRLPGGIGWTVSTSPRRQTTSKCFARECDTEMGTAARALNNRAHQRGQWHPDPIPSGPAPRNPQPSPLMRPITSVTRREGFARGGSGGLLDSVATLQLPETDRGTGVKLARTPELGLKSLCAWALGMLAGDESRTGGSWRRLPNARQMFPP
jgi:hypothetical protein